MKFKVTKADGRFDEAKYVAKNGSVELHYGPPRPSTRRLHDEFPLIEVVIRDEGGLGEYIVTGGTCNHIPTINAMRELEQSDSRKQKILDRIEAAREELAEAEAELELMD